MDPRDGSDAMDEPVEGDALDHLWTAAQEMLRAMRMVIDAADEFVASQRGARTAPWVTTDDEGSVDARGARNPRERRMHRIDIDVRDDDGSGGRTAEHAGDRTGTGAP